MLSSKLLRFKDLTCVSITNWPTLKRRVLNDGFPPGRYVGHLRIWTVEEVEEWWKSRPSAAPPDITEPAAPVDAGNGRKAIKTKHPFNTESDPTAQPLPIGRSRG